MNCEDFKEKMVEMFDNQPDPQTVAELESHMESCTACRDYYEQTKAVAEMLTPRHAPQPKARRLRLPKVLGRVAIACLIFGAGVVAGMCGLFSSEARATSAFSIGDGLANIEKTGSCTMKLLARTLNDENFAYFDPKCPFMPITVMQLRQRDTLLWRVEKKHGRTALFDGRRQCMWTSGGLMWEAPAEYNLIEDMAVLLHPRYLLKRQADWIERKNARMSVAETDSSWVIVTKTGQWKIENTFLKRDRLLHGVRAWMTSGGGETLVMRSTEISYDAPIDRRQLLRLPKDFDSKATNLAESLSASRHRKAQLSKESAAEAAERIMTALAKGDTLSRSEAWVNYRQTMPQLVEAYRGRRMSGFKERKSKDYAGTLVVFNSITASGDTLRSQIALRRGQQGWWVVDGGI